MTERETAPVRDTVVPVRGEDALSSPIVKTREPLRTVVAPDDADAPAAVADAAFLLLDVDDASDVVDAVPDEGAAFLPTVCRETVVRFAVSEFLVETCALSDTDADDGIARDMVAVPSANADGVQNATAKMQSANFFILWIIISQQTMPEKT